MSQGLGQMMLKTGVGGTTDEDSTTPPLLTVDQQVTSINTVFHPPSIVPDAAPRSHHEADTQWHFDL
jgi:hypothetical protein